MSLEKIRKMIGAKENRRTFFKRVAVIFPESDKRYKLIEKAYNAAKDAFRGKYRDDGEIRSFEHSRAVAVIIMDYLRIRDADIIAGGLLHDIVEDSQYWTVKRVRDQFNKKVAFIVDSVSKPSGFKSDKKRDDAYHRRLQSAPRRVLLVKLSDRLHNTLTLGSCSKSKIKRKIAETKRHYLPLAERELVFLHELEAALEELKK